MNSQRTRRLRQSYVLIAAGSGAVLWSALVLVAMYGGLWLSAASR